MINENMFGLNFHTLNISQPELILKKLIPLEYKETPSIMEDTKLCEVLTQYIINETDLQNMNPLDRDEYVLKDKYHFFTQDVIQKLARIITTVHQQHDDKNPIFISRKVTKIPWKIIFQKGSKTTEKVVLLLHKKNMFYTDSGASKIGRLAVKLVKNQDEWDAKLLYNLSSRQGKIAFLQANATENHLYQKCSAVLPKRYFNYYQPTQKNPNK